jgi:predicted secreted hydrolase
MSQRRLIILSLLALAGLGGLLQWAQRDGPPPPEFPLDAAFVGLEERARAFPAPGTEPLQWPRDHASRAEQFTESWLFAGRFTDDAGTGHAFQLAFLRIAIEPGAPVRDSAWGTRDVWRARLVLEEAGGAAHAEERFSRGALGLAGAEESGAAWVEDWRFELDSQGEHFTLQASAAGRVLRLTLRAAGNPPLGVSAELYRGYWWPGLELSGTLEQAGSTRQVTGQAMLDRLWGRAQPVGRGQMALARLWFESGDGAGLRCEQLRRRAGGGVPLTECLQFPSGEAMDARLEPDERGWTGIDGVRYPLQWTLADPAREASVRLTPLAGTPAAFADGTLAASLRPGARGEAGSGWGLVELSNFSAP